MLLISHHTRAFSHHLQTARAKVDWLTPGSIFFFSSPTRSFKDKLRLCSALCSKKRRDGSLRALTVSEMSASVTEGGLRWIRYGFINEQQAGTAVAISYRVVSICKAGRTREKWEKEKEGGGWDGTTPSEKRGNAARRLEDRSRRRGSEFFRESNAVLFCKRCYSSGLNVNARWIIVCAKGEPRGLLMTMNFSTPL